MAIPKRVRIIDSHTGGEPTRVVIEGGPDLGGGPLAQRRDILRQDHDDFRRSVIHEPRGSEVLVGALLCQPVTPQCVAGVIFFNNVGYLGMCGHGAMGVVVTLAHLGRIGPGEHRLETPVGVVSFHYHGGHAVTLENVPSYRHAANLTVHLDDYGDVKGDVAWGGNWFFLVSDHREQMNLANVERLTDVTWRIRQSLARQRITGANGAEIDHIELLGPPQARDADSKNFVLCPGKAYDRSPCGTGTSAKVACLIADGQLQPGSIWRQEGIVGSIFEASARIEGKQIIPSIKGSAYITSEASLVLDDDDPFCSGIQA